MAFELYFPEKLKAECKETLKHLGELKPITGDMTDEEKMAVIQSEFNRLYDPGHPVRNNLETLKRCGSSKGSAEREKREW